MGRTTAPNEAHHQGGNANPAQKLVENQTQAANPIMVGAWTLPAGLIAKIDDFEPRPLTLEDVAKLTSKTQARYKLHDGRLHAGQSPDHPLVGDVRVSLLVNKPSPVPPLGQQTQTTLAPDTARRGGTLFELKPGLLSFQSLFQNSAQESAMILWIFRLVGAVLMCIGVAVILQPIKILADFFPLFGSLAEVGLGVLAFLFSCGMSLLAISIGWIAYRPLPGIQLLLGSGGMFAGIDYLFSQQRQQNAVRLASQNRPQNRTPRRPPPVPRQRPALDE